MAAWMPGGLPGRLSVEERSISVEGWSVSPEGGLESCSQSPAEWGQFASILSDSGRRAILLRSRRGVRLSEISYHRGPIPQAPWCSRCRLRRVGGGCWVSVSTTPTDCPSGHITLVTLTGQVSLCVAGQKQHANMRSGRLLPRPTMDADGVWSTPRNGRWAGHGRQWAGRRSSPCS